MSLAGRTVVAVDCMFSSLGVDLNGNVDDDPLAAEPTVLQWPTAGRTTGKVMLFVAVDLRGRPPARLLVPWLGAQQSLALSPGGLLWRGIRPDSFAGLMTMDEPKAVRRVARRLETASRAICTRIAQQTASLLVCCLAS